MARLQAELEINLEAQGQFDVSWLNKKQGELSQQKNQIFSEISSLEVDLENPNEKPLQEKTFRNRTRYQKSWRTKKGNLYQERRIRKIIQTNQPLRCGYRSQPEAQGQFDVSWLNNKQEELLQQKIAN